MNVYVSFINKVTEEAFLKAFHEININRFNGALVISAESKSGSVVLTVKAKEKDYKLINLSYTLDPMGCLMEWTQGSDALVFWLRETMGHMVAESLGGMVTYESNMELSSVPSYHKKLPTFESYLLSRNIDTTEYAYLTPPSLELILNKSI